MRSAYDFYMKSKADRPRQVWKKRTKTGGVSRLNAATKGEKGAIPIHVEK